MIFVEATEQSRMQRLGLKVSYYRKIAGLSAESLAEKSKLSVSTIWQLESPTNPKPVSVKTLWRISDALGIHVTKLLAED